MKYFVQKLKQEVPRTSNPLCHYTCYHLQL